MAHDMALYDNSYVVQDKRDTEPTDSGLKVIFARKKGTFYHILQEKHISSHLLRCETSELLHVSPTLGVQQAGVKTDARCKNMIMIIMR